MSDPSVLFVKPGAISANDKRALQKALVIVVEVEDLSAVKFVRPSAELSGSDLLVAAATAISKCSYDEARTRFAHAICAAIALNGGRAA